MSLWQWGDPVTYDSLFNAGLFNEVIAAVNERAATSLVFTGTDPYKFRPVTPKIDNRYPNHLRTHALNELDADGYLVGQDHPWGSSQVRNYGPIGTTPPLTGWWINKSIGEIQTLIYEMMGKFFDLTRFPTGFAGNGDYPYFGLLYPLNTLSLMRYLGYPSNCIPEPYDPDTPSLIPDPHVPPANPSFPYITNPAWIISPATDYFDYVTPTYDPVDPAGVPADNIVIRQSAGGLRRKCPRRIYSITGNSRREGYYTKSDYAVGDKAQYYASSFGGVVFGVYKGIYEYRGGGTWTPADDRHAVADILDSCNPWQSKDWTSPGKLVVGDYINTYIFEDIIATLKLFKKTFSTSPQRHIIYTAFGNSASYNVSTDPSAVANAIAESESKLTDDIATFGAPDETTPGDGNHIGGGGSFQMIGSAVQDPAPGLGNGFTSARGQTFRDYVRFLNHQGIARTSEYYSLFYNGSSGAPTDVRQLTHLGYTENIFNLVTTKHRDAGGWVIEPDSPYAMINNFEFPAYYGPGDVQYARRALTDGTAVLEAWEYQYT